MAGYTIANQQSLHYLTLTVIGWVDVFSRDCYRAILLESLGMSGRRHSLRLTGLGFRVLCYGQRWEAVEVGLHGERLTGEGIFQVTVMDDIWSDVKWE